MMRSAVRLAIAAKACVAAILLSASGGPAAARPEVVSIELGYPAGSIVIVNTERKIYYVTGTDKAIRYGIAVGKESELWTGRTFVSDKKEDPRWVPIDGEPPVEGGDPANPLGKRALYLDWSLLRIHGTPSRGSIGAAVSNGCIRMLNEDVIDLFERVHIGAPVFAINTRQQAGAFKDAKVADFVYVNPGARLDAKAEQQDAAERRRRQLADRDDDEWLPPPSRWSGRDYAPPPRFYYPPGYRSGYRYNTW